LELIGWLLACLPACLLAFFALLALLCFALLCFALLYTFLFTLPFALLCSSLLRFALLFSVLLCFVCFAL